MMRAFIYMMVLLSCLCGFTTTAWADGNKVFILTNNEWNVPRTTRTVLDMPALRKTIQAYDKHTGSRIQIHYPGGDEGTLWASELRSWFVSLGVASNHIVLLPGTRKPGQLELQVMLSSPFGQTND